MCLQQNTLIKNEVLTQKDHTKKQDSTPICLWILWPPASFVNNKPNLKKLCFAVAQ